MAPTMPKQGEGLLQTLISAFQDENLGISHDGGFPFIIDETAQCHLFRIMDIRNIEMWDTISTIAISKEVILTLLQYTVRLYKDEFYIKVAMDLIKSNHT